MLKQKKPPTVFHDDDGTFADYSKEALDYARDGFTVPLVALEDKLYFGLYKQFNAVYVELTTANTQANDLTVELWNGTSWVGVSNLVEETRGFTRSGFIRWDRPRDKDAWQANTVNSTDKFWIRITASADWDAGTEVKGMNIVFSDDQDLLAEYPEIQDYRSSNETSFILRHQAARDDIVQDLRIEGWTSRAVKDPVTGDPISFVRDEDLEAWDLLEIDEVNLWATYLVLAKVFSNNQSTQDDFFLNKRDEYLAKVDRAKRLFIIKLDTDDDGIEDTNEAKTFRTAAVQRR